MKHGAGSVERASDSNLEAMVTRRERALFAGTSTHRDVEELVAAEQEILRREARRVRRTAREEREERTRSSGGGWIALGRGGRSSSG